MSAAGEGVAGGSRELCAADLQRRLNEAFAGMNRKRVVVAFTAAGERGYAALGGAADARTEAAEWPLPTGCVTKLLLGALVAGEVAAGRMALDEPVAPRLADSRRAVLIRATSVKHLLEHTCGVDDSALKHAAIRADGFIDLDGLLERLKGHRFAEPGALYSYSNAGAWILAALLESMLGQRFEQLLRARLLAPLGLRARRHVPSLVPACAEGICPSMGATLALSADDMLTFLEAQLDSSYGWPIPASIRSLVTSLPGWNPLEQGVYLGWKYHGDGWLGHNSNWSGGSLMVRIRPRDRLGLVLASRDHPVPVVAAKLLASVLPEYRNLSFPKPLSADRVAELDLRPYCGVYRSAAEDVAVEMRTDGPRALRLRGRSFDSKLRPAANEVFFARRAGPEQRAFVQFLGETDGAFRYLWDGRCLLRR